MTQEEQIALCQLHQQQLQFQHFDHDSAWTVGNMLYAEAIRQGHALALDITVNQHCLFSSLMPGATAENIDWVRRKRNVVNLLGMSSWSAGLMLASRHTTLAERYGLNDRDYAAFGGSYPLMITGCGSVGTITVSGAPQRDDHNLVISVIARAIGLPPGELTLIPAQ